MNAPTLIFILMHKEGMEKWFGLVFSYSFTVFTPNHYPMQVMNYSVKTVGSGTGKYGFMPL